MAFALACSGCGEYLMPDGSTKAGLWGAIPNGASVFKTKFAADCGAHRAGWFVPSILERRMLKVPGFKCQACTREKIPAQFTLVRRYSEDLVVRSDEGKVEQC